MDDKTEFIVEYITYAGKLRQSIIHAIDKDEALDEFFKEQGSGCYSSDDCHKIIGVS